MTRYANALSPSFSERDSYHYVHKQCVKRLKMDKTCVGRRSQVFITLTVALIRTAYHFYNVLTLFSVSISFEKKT